MKLIKNLSEVFINLSSTSYMMYACFSFGIEWAISFFKPDKVYLRWSTCEKLAPLWTWPELDLVSLNRSVPRSINFCKRGSVQKSVRSSSNVYFYIWELGTGPDLLSLNRSGLWSINFCKTCPVQKLVLSDSNAYFYILKPGAGPWHLTW